MHFSVLYRGQPADGTSDAQMLMHGSCGYLPLNDILQLPAKDIIDEIWKESNVDTEMWHPNPSSFPTTETRFHKMKWKLQRRTIRPL